MGCKGISNSHLGMPGRILAVCDVDSQRMAQRQGQAIKRGNKDVKADADLREIIARDDIDIIYHSSLHPATLACPHGDCGGQGWKAYLGRKAHVPDYW